MDVFRAFARLNRKGKMRLWKRIKEECATYPLDLQRVPRPDNIPPGFLNPSECWRSRGYVVQIYDLGNGWERMSVNRNAFNADFTRFLDGISWDTMQSLKRQCGRGSNEAVEIYPGEEDVINVANLRHLWIKTNGSIIEEFKIGWKQNSENAQSAIAHSTNHIADISPSAHTDVIADRFPTLARAADIAG